MVSKTKKGSTSGMGVMQTIPYSAANKKRNWAYDNYGPTISGGSRIDSMVTKEAQARISKVNRQADKKFGFTHDEYARQRFNEYGRAAGRSESKRIRAAGKSSGIPAGVTRALGKAKAGRKDLVTKSK